VVCVSVRKQYGIELGQRIELDSRRTHSRENFAECGIEVGVGKKPLPANLD
jgi:hypothetical protein